MQIQLKDSTGGSTSTIDIDENDTILSIKEKIGGSKGIDATQINLVFNGKSLQNNSTAKDYDLQEGSIVHQVLQLKGGKY